MQNKKHFIIITVLILLVSVLTYYALLSIGLMPVSASIQSKPIDWLFDLEFKLIAFFFSLIMVPLVYSLVVFRRKDGDETDGPHIEGHTNLELIWTAVPLIIVIALGVIGADNLKQVLAVDPQAHQVKVVGFQWGWRFEYPEGFTTNTLYLPVDQQVLLNLESTDVLHSFWVPEFRIKQDLVPGQITEYRITPSLIGNYKVRCAEICGTSHSYMEAPVIVLSQADYAVWRDDQIKLAKEQELASAGKPDAGRGQVLYQESGCKACHSVDGSKGVGPTWDGLFESNVPLADGTTVAADEAFVRESILMPSAKVVKGYSPNAMPNFSYLKDGQVNDIIEYIKTLK
jgi:cytochrome c oxidase subunit 2